jgi:septal ring factor EnvC (AmiA/AmiB activator)
MGSFKRSLLGYRRHDVEAALAARDLRIRRLETDLGRRRDALAELEAEMAALSGMVIDREREIRALWVRLQEAHECHDRSIASLDAVSTRLEELEAQARGQATRIRMKALREAV